MIFWIGCGMHFTTRAHGISPAIGGSDAQWHDQSNPLTYAILEVTTRKVYHTPNLTLRVHRNTPQKIWEMASHCLSTGCGLPAIYNDEVVCPALEKIGISPDDAHAYCLNGCNQIDIMGKSHMGLEDGEVNFLKCLEWVLREEQAEHYTTWEELKNAFIDTLHRACDMVCEMANRSAPETFWYRGTKPAAFAVF